MPEQKQSIKGKNREPDRTCSVSEDAVLQLAKGAVESTTPTRQGRMKADFIERPATVADRLSIARPTLYRWMKEGRFPKPIRLGGGSVGWLSSEVDQWIADQAAASRQTA